MRRFLQNIWKYFTPKARKLFPSHAADFAKQPKNSLKNPPEKTAVIF